MVVTRRRSTPMDTSDRAMGGAMPVRMTVQLDILDELRVVPEEGSGLLEAQQVVVEVLDEAVAILLSKFVDVQQPLDVLVGEPQELLAAGDLLVGDPHLLRKRQVKDALGKG